MNTIRVIYYPPMPTGKPPTEYRVCELLSFQPDVDGRRRMKFRGVATIVYQDWMQHEAYERQPDGTMKIREFMIDERDVNTLYSQR